MYLKAPAGVANSVDPDQNNAASDLGVHCLGLCLRVFRVINTVKDTTTRAYIYNNWSPLSSCSKNSYHEACQITQDEWNVQGR